MKKIVTAAVLGAVLVAGQAVASTQAAPRIADRVGATAGEADGLAAIPVPLLFLGGAILAGVIIDQATDDSDSD